eukprot:gene3931-4295_t
MLNDGIFPSNSISPPSEAVISNLCEVLMAPSQVHHQPWHNDQHLAQRTEMCKTIATILNSKTSLADDKALSIAKLIEVKLYSCATSLEEYQDRDSLSTRVKHLVVELLREAKRIQSNGTNKEKPESAPIDLTNDRSSSANQPKPQLSQRCSRAFIVEMLDRLLTNSFKKPHVNVQGSKDGIFQWLVEVRSELASLRADNDGVLPQDELYGGVSFNETDPSTYWTDESQFATWWKNNVVKRSKYEQMLEQAKYNGGSLRKEHNAAFYTAVIERVENIRRESLKLMGSNQGAGNQEASLATNHENGASASSRDVYYNNFVLLLFRLLSDDKTSCVRWEDTVRTSSSSRESTSIGYDSFVIDSNEFATTAMKHYFSNLNLESFERQLEIHGFTVDHVNGKIRGFHTHLKRGDQSSADALQALYRKQHRAPQSGPRVSQTALYALQLQRMLREQLGTEQKQQLEQLESLPASSSSTGISPPSTSAAMLPPSLPSLAGAINASTVSGNAAPAGRTLLGTSSGNAAPAGRTLLGGALPATASGTAIGNTSLFGTTRSTTLPRVDTAIPGTALSSATLLGNALAGAVPGSNLPGTAASSVPSTSLFQPTLPMNPLPLSMLAQCSQMNSVPNLASLPSFSGLSNEAGPFHSSGRNTAYCPPLSSFSSILPNAPQPSLLGGVSGNPFPLLNPAGNPWTDNSLFGMNAFPYQSPLPTANNQALLLMQNLMQSQLSDPLTMVMMQTMQACLTSVSQQINQALHPFLAPYILSTTPSSSVYPGFTATGYPSQFHVYPTQLEAQTEAVPSAAPKQVAKEAEMENEKKEAEMTEVGKAEERRQASKRRRNRNSFPSSPIITAPPLAIVNEDDIYAKPYKTSRRRRSADDAAVVSSANQDEVYQSKLWRSTRKRKNGRSGRDSAPLHALIPSNPGGSDDESVNSDDSSSIASLDEKATIASNADVNARQVVDAVVESMSLYPCDMLDLSQPRARRVYVDLTMDVPLNDDVNARRARKVFHGKLVAFRGDLPAPSTNIEPQQASAKASREHKTSRYNSDYARHSSRIGENYQATLPSLQLMPHWTRRELDRSRESLVWDSTMHQEDYLCRQLQKIRNGARSIMRESIQPGNMYILKFSSFNPESSNRSLTRPKYSLCVVLEVGVSAPDGENSENEAGSGQEDEDDDDASNVWIKIYDGEEEIDVHSNQLLPIYGLTEDYLLPALHDKNLRSSLAEYYDGIFHRIYNYSSIDVDDDDEEAPRWTSREARLFSTAIKRHSDNVAKVWRLCFATTRSLKQVLDFYYRIYCTYLAAAPRKVFRVFSTADQLVEESRKAILEREELEINMTKEGIKESDNDSESLVSHSEVIEEEDVEEEEEEEEVEDEDVVEEDVIDKAEREDEASTKESDKSEEGDEDGNDEEGDDEEDAKHVPEVTRDSDEEGVAMIKKKRRKKGRVRLTLVRHRNQKTAKRRDSSAEEVLVAPKRNDNRPANSRKASVRDSEELVETVPVKRRRVSAPAAISIDSKSGDPEMSLVSDGEVNIGDSSVRRGNVRRKSLADIINATRDSDPASKYTIRLDDGHYGYLSIAPQVVPRNGLKLCFCEKPANRHERYLKCTLGIKCHGFCHLSCLNLSHASDFKLRTQYMNYICPPCHSFTNESEEEETRVTRSQIKSKAR